MSRQDVFCTMLDSCFHQPYTFTRHEQFGQTEFYPGKAAIRAIKWSRHGLSELAQESFTVPDVELAIRTAEVIEDSPHQHRHFPDCLILAWISQEQPVHCVVAINEISDYILIVTVYQPSSKEWHNDRRTRK